MTSRWESIGSERFESHRHNDVTTAGSFGQFKSCSSGDGTTPGKTPRIGVQVRALWDAGWRDPFTVPGAPLSWEGLRVARFVGGRQHRHLLQLGGPSGGAAQPVEGTVAGRRGEPEAGVARDAVAPPALERQREGVLRALLGDVPVARHPDQGGDDRPPLLAEGPGDGGFDVGRYISQIGLTSIVPFRALGIFDATSMASSRSLQSATK